MTLRDEIGGESETTRDLLLYLFENPNAADSLEGIVQWWLLKSKSEISKAKVKEALEQLIARGFIVKQIGSDSRVRYRINDDRRQEITTAFDETNQSS